MGPVCLFPLLPLALIFVTLSGCQRTAAEATAPPPPQVTVSRPLKIPVTEFREFTGETEAMEAVDIRARVRGFLEKIHFREGVEVEQEDVLYEIERESFEATVRSRQAELDRMKAQLRLARSEERRAQGLRPTSAITEEEYQQRVAAREQAEAALAEAEAALEAAELELSYTKIEAPISGRIGRTLVTEGNLVGYNEPTLLTTIVKMDPIYVYFYATERGFLEYERRIREEGLATASQRQMPVYVRLANEQGYPHEGVIDFRESQIDPNTGTIRIRAVLENDQRILTPGLFTRVRVPIGEPRDQLVVPQDAILTDQRGDYALTVDAENTVEYRPVTTGQRVGSLIVIEKGIAANDRVVINGMQKARPEAKVAAQQGTIEPPSETSIAQAAATNE